MELLHKHKINSAKLEGEYLILDVDGQEQKWNINQISVILSNASESDRDNFKISPSGYGIHWPNLDEDLSLRGLLNLKNKNL